MKKNAGTIDRTVRVIAGIAILATAFIGPKTILGYIGIVPILTGALGFCPVYPIFGINTCKLTK
jgi:cadmium resistance protein CadD (predicted permease)